MRKNYRYWIVILAIALIVPTGRIWRASVQAALTADTKSSSSYSGKDADFFRGRDLFDRGETSQAEVFLEQYLKNVPGGNYVLQARFLLAVMEDDIERAKDAFWQISQDFSHPSLARHAEFQFACLLLLDGDYSEASDSFERLAAMLNAGGEVSPLSSVASVQLPEWNNAALYVACLALSKRVPTAQNACQLYSHTSWGKDAKARWAVLEGDIALLQGEGAKARRTFQNLLENYRDASFGAVGLFYLLSAEGMRLSPSEKQYLEQTVQKVFPGSPEAFVLRKQQGKDTD